MSLQELQTRLHAKYGILPRDDWGRIVDSIVCAADASPHALLRDLCERVFSTPELEQRLLSALTVNESYFFRHPEHYSACADALVDLASRHEGQLKIWSAGCSRGEEAYSIALALRARLAESVFQRIEIRGTDVSPAAVQAACEGRYSAWSLRALSESEVERHFRRDGDSWFLHSRLRGSITFNQASLRQECRMLRPGSLAVIFFRNVSIYLDAREVSELYARFFHLLQPGGLLLVAPTDHRPPGEFFERQGEDTTAFIRRAELGSSTSPSARALVVTPPSRSSRVRTEIAVRRSVRRGPELTTQTRATSPLGRESSLHAGIRLFAQDDVKGASQMLRRATFEAPEEPLARYWYALALFTEGLVQRCWGQLSTLETLLQSKAAHEALSLDGTTVEELRSAAKELKERLA